MGNSGGQWEARAVLAPSLFLQKSGIEEKAKQICSWTEKGKSGTYSNKNPGKMKFKEKDIKILTECASPSDGKMYGQIINENE